jgi:hypothetical protein
MQIAVIDWTGYLDEEKERLDAIERDCRRRLAYQQERGVQHGSIHQEPGCSFREEWWRPKLRSQEIDTVLERQQWPRSLAAPWSIFG